MASWSVQSLLLYLEDFLVTVPFALSTGSSRATFIHHSWLGLKVYDWRFCTLYFSSFLFLIVIVDCVVLKKYAHPPTGGLLI